MLADFHVFIYPSYPFDLLRIYIKQLRRLIQTPRELLKALG